MKKRGPTSRTRKSGRLKRFWRFFALSGPSRGAGTGDFYDGTTIDMTDYAQLCGPGDILAAIANVSSLHGIDSVMHEKGRDFVRSQPDVEPPSLPPVPFPDRFEIVSKPDRPGGVLGKGATSCVYAVFDKERREHVAMKVLRIPEARKLFELEYNEMSQIAHANLVKPFTLYDDGKSLGMTMRLIEGGSVAQWASQGSNGGEPKAHRFRRAAVQIYLGVCALHDEDHIHQDLKPDNILVDENGHLFITDFGLVIRPADYQSPMPSHIETRYAGGTLAYMSPEQHRREKLTGHSDWYSVGVILYRLLMGDTPFPSTDDAEELLGYKESESYPPLPEFEDRWTNSAARLCQRLLKADPNERPSREEIRRMLEISEEDDILNFLHNFRPEMVGREAENRQFQQWLADATAGGEDAGGRKLVVGQIQGKSGVGKSFVVANFLRTFDCDEETVVLPGKCQQHRKTPRNAIKPLIEQLAAYLRNLPTIERARFLLEEVSAAGPLSQVFPELFEVPELQNAALAQAQMKNLPPHELRQRALDGLTELLGKISLRRRLILVIDDIQWADELSLEAIDSLLKSRPGKGMLLITVERSEAGENESLAGFRESLARAGDSILTDKMELKPLGAKEAAELARQLRGSRSIDVDKVVEGSGGHPQMIAALVHFGDNDAGNLNVEQLFWKRFETLPDAPRNLVAVLAVAGQPVHRAVAFEAAGIVNESKSLIESDLEGIYTFLKSHGAEQKHEIDIFHDKMREGILTYMHQAQKAAWHEKLAVAYEKSEFATGEILAVHFEEAGPQHFEKAGRYYLQAGDEAMENLAFKAALGYYTKSRDLRPGLDGAELARVLEKQGEALICLGKGVEGGERFEEASTLLLDGERDRMRHRATEHFLISGKTQRAIDGLDDLLKAAKLRMSAPAFAALTTELRRFVKLKKHPLTFRAIPAEKRSKRQQQLIDQIDRGWTLVLGYGFREVMISGEFQNVVLFRCLKAGCPARLIRALCMESWYQAAFGRKRLPEVERFFKRARELNDGEGHDDDYSRGFIELARGASGWLMGHFERSADHNRRAVDIFRNKVPGHYWEPDTGLSYQLFALVNLGDFAEVNRICDEKLPEADLLGDRYLLTNLACYPKPWGLIAADQPEDAAEMARSHIAAWIADQGANPGHQQAQHLLAWISQIEAALYRSDPETAREIIGEGWRNYRGSMLHLVQHCRIQVNHCRGRVYAQQAADCNGSRRRGLLKKAEADAKALIDEHDRPWAWGLGRSLQASVDLMRGNEENAIRNLTQAAEDLRTGEALAQQAAAEYRLGEISGDSASVTRAEAILREKGVRRPEKFARLLVN